MEQQVPPEPPELVQQVQQALRVLVPLEQLARLAMTVQPVPQVLAPLALPASRGPLESLEFRGPQAYKALPAQQVLLA
jgi:hypothetical protein